MATDGTAASLGGELRQLADQQDAWEQYEQAEREALAARLDTAINTVRDLEAVLEEIRAELG